MSVRPANKQAVLLHQPEPGRGLPGAGQLAPEPRAPQVEQEAPAHAGDAAAAGEDVEGDALAEQDAAGGAGDGGHGHLDAAGVAAALDVAALPGVPLDGAAALGKDLVEEGHARQDPRGLAPEGGGARGVADHEAAVVEGGRVLGQPAGDLGLPGGREEVLQGAVVEGLVPHFVLGREVCGIWDAMWVRG